MSNYLERFENCWVRFENNLRGKIMDKTKTQEMSLSLANLVMGEALSEWYTNYSVEGKMLSDITKENPKKGDMILNTLKKEVRFTKEIKSVHLPYLFKLIVALLVGGISLMLCILLSPSRVHEVVSFALGTMITYVLINEIDKNLETSSKKTQLQEYINQLEPYKIKITDIIKNK